MKVYLVREYGRRAIHGIFWAETPADLWDVVDEMSDPVDFEYAELERPGGLWREGMIGEIPEPPQDSDMPEDADVVEDMLQTAGGILPNPTISEHLEWAVHRQSDLEWTRFDATNEGVGLVARVMKAAGRR